MDDPPFAHHSDEKLPIGSGSDLLTVPSEQLPTLIRNAGENAERRFLEFFTAHIRNPGTRQVYAHAVGRFSQWCERYGVSLEQVTPFIVAGYVEQLTTSLSNPTVKLHLAAIRMLFDWLVTGQVVPVNPAASVRGPKHVVRKGKTPVLTAAEARQLLDSIDCTKIVGLRDRALIGVMVYTRRVVERVQTRAGQQSVSRLGQRRKRTCNAAVACNHSTDSLTDVRSEAVCRWRRNVAQPHIQYSGCAEMILGSDDDHAVVTTGTVYW
jgi:hypothetical protein